MTPENPHHGPAPAEREPAPMTASQATRYVHAIVRQHLLGEFIPSMEAIVQTEGAPEVDVKDAQLCVEHAKSMVANLAAIDDALLASEQRVIVTPAAKQILKGKGGF